jgi:Fe-S-cluster-containing dehydrogenase component/DMSO reductase anchor subunit
VTSPHLSVIDELLAEQRTLSAAGIFAARHDQGEFPAQEKYYRDLIPLSRPRPGEQYAFEVDLEQCTGCKACVTACHNLNGLDENETWRDVGLLLGGTAAAPWQQVVTTACHHCVDPACANGCPVLAYEKNPVTGIVHHLDDQCIGCQYCIWKCPYDAPKYSAARGIVRKCDMCSARLAAGEAPACVQACPSEAIRITLVEQEQLSVRFRQETAGEFLAGCPSPNYTLPTTRYAGQEELPPNMTAADAHANQPQPAHYSLIAMLLLTQMSVGTLVFDLLLGRLSTTGISAAAHQKNLVAAFASVLVGLASSILHLGRPGRAWRSFLGLRKSWLSREIVAFAIYAIFCAAGMVALLRSWPMGIQSILQMAGAIVGVAGVFSSVMIYHDTHRPFWKGTMGATKFFGTTLLLGAATCGVSVSGDVPWPNFLAAALVIVAAAKWVSETVWHRHGGASESTALLVGPLRRAVHGRGAFAIAGAFFAAVTLFSSVPANLTFLFALITAVFFFAGEMCERYLFFSAVVPLKMPGNIAS